MRIFVNARPLYAVDTIKPGPDVINSILYIQPENQPVLVLLQVISSTEAIARGISRYRGVTVRAYAENGNNYLCFSGYISKIYNRQKAAWGTSEAWVARIGSHLM